MICAFCNPFFIRKNLDLLACYSENHLNTAIIDGIGIALLLVMTMMTGITFRND